jgi:HK97 gp10 family phage protein
MANTIDMEWKGLAEMVGRFRELQFAVKDRIAYAGAGAGARVLKDAAVTQAVSNGLVDTGALVGGIAFAKIKTSGNGQYTYVVGVRHGKKRSKQQKADEDDPWYWWFHEFGTVKMPARPFITPAFESAGVRAEMLEKARKMVIRGIERHEAKTGKKTSTE